jgi:hypothetical protein
MDIAVKNPYYPSQFILGISFDGSNYNEAQSVEDRECIRTQVLKKLGWEYQQIWTMDWVKNSQAVLNNILQKLDDIKKHLPYFLPDVSPPLPEQPIKSKEHPNNRTTKKYSEKTQKKLTELSTELPTKFSTNITDKKTHQQESDNIINGEFEVMENDTTIAHIKKLAQKQLSTLQQKLENYQQRMIKQYPDIPENQQLLQPKILHALMSYIPKNKQEFKQLIPANLHNRIHPAQLEHIIKILDITGKTASVLKQLGWNLSRYNDQSKPIITLGYDKIE